MFRVAVPALAAAVLAAAQSSPPVELPAVATTRLVDSLDVSKPHVAHVWRDTPPINEDGTVNGYVEITRGDRRKFEFDMKANERAIDRMIPPSVGGYPVNYGFVPQTISYDGDPFDILVLGPPLAGGSLVRGIIVGVMYMEDEKGLDSKVVVSVAGPDGKPKYRSPARSSGGLATTSIDTSGMSPGRSHACPDGARWPTASPS